MELAEKQKKDKKPIELQDPAKAHAPAQSFGGKENEKKTIEEKTTEKKTPVFGTFGKNLTAKAVTQENGNGDSVENKEKSEEAETEVQMGSNKATAVFWRYLIFYNEI